MPGDHQIPAWEKFLQAMPTRLSACRAGWKSQPGTDGVLQIDCDLYASTKTIFDLIVPGTVIAF
jgi:hypothetical protein